MQSVVLLDWIFAGVLLLSMLVGAMRGLVYEVLSLVIWVLAFFLAQWLAPDLAARLPMGNASEVVRYAAAFAVVFALVVFAGSLLTWLVSKLFAAVGLRPADRALGAIFGVVRGLVVLLAVAVLVAMSPMKNESWWKASTGAVWATRAASAVGPLLPPELGRYMP